MMTARMITTKDPLPNEPTVINETTPLWKRDLKELKDEDYINFYRSKFPMDPAPLFWIHLKIDHPFTLDGILYFPKLIKTDHLMSSTLDCTRSKCL